MVLMMIGADWGMMHRLQALGTWQWCGRPRVLGSAH